MTIKRTAVILIAAAAAGCATFGWVSRDYILGVTCRVVDAQGAPVADAEVILELAEAAYQATVPVCREAKVTPEHGGVVFMYLTHRRSTPYALTARKTGYREATVRGAASSNTQQVLTLLAVDMREAQ